MRVLTVAAMAALLSACGFQPMYAPAAKGGLGAVALGEVSGKSGHSFRSEMNRLLDMERDDAAPRRLEVTVNERINRLGLRIDESASRADLIVTGAYKLFDTNGQEILNGQVTSIVSYDIPVQAFGEISAQNDARERAGVQLAEKMRAELSLLLAQKRNGA
jgi:LPS-assembly lipoprotein